MLIDRKKIETMIRDKVLRARELGPRGVLQEMIGIVRYWGRILRQTWRLFLDNHGQYQANALAYRSMVSLVPMLAFMISLLTLMMKRTPDDLSNDITEMMKNYIVPNEDIIQSFASIINLAVTQAREGTFLGFVILLLTSIFLLSAIEQIFNNIWHITRRRPLSWRVLSYTALIVLIPVMLGLSLYMTVDMQLNNVIAQFKAPVIGHLPVVQQSWTLAKNLGVPLLLAWLLFVALYKWMPNTKVESYSAAIAALIGAVLFEVCKWGFSSFAAQMVARKQVLWGSLGVFLVFLMWVYLIWWVILFCAQLAYVIQNYRYVLRQGYQLEGRVGEAFIAASAMLEVAGRHLRGDKPPTVRELAEKLEVEVPRVQHSVAKLIDSNLLIIGAAGKNREEEVYLPGRDLSRITLTEVIQCATDIWRIPPSTRRARGAGPGPGEEKLEAILRQSQSKVQEVLDLTVRELLT